MACSNKVTVVCDNSSDSAGQRCGSIVAFPFFISFYVLCSFLVSRPDLLFTHVFSCFRLLDPQTTCVSVQLCILLPSQFSSNCNGSLLFTCLVSIGPPLFCGLIFPFRLNSEIWRSRLINYNWAEAYSGTISNLSWVTRKRPHKFFLGRLILGYIYRYIPSRSAPGW